MTDEKRFCDNGDGTATDNETKLMWKQTDAYQDTSQWCNWFKAEEYVRDLGLNEFAGYKNWRMPTLEEAEELYDEDHHIRPFLQEEGLPHGPPMSARTERLVFFISDMATPI